MEVWEQQAAAGRDPGAEDAADGGGWAAPDPGGRRWRRGDLAALWGVGVLGVLVAGMVLAQAGRGLYVDPAWSDLGDRSFPPPCDARSGHAGAEAWGDECWRAGRLRRQNNATDADDGGVLDVSGGEEAGAGNESTVTAKNSSTTTVVDVVIERNKTSNASAAVEQNISVLEQELGGSNSNSSNGLENDVRDSLGLSSRTHVLLWVITAFFAAIALILTWVASSRRQRSHSINNLLILILHFIIVTLGYMAMGLDVGRTYQVVAVRVMEGIIITPGQLISQPVVPPVFWGRHLSWALSTPLQLILVISVAGDPIRQGKGKDATWRKVPFTLKLYLVGVNWCLHGCGVIATLVPHIQLSKWTYWVAGIVFFFTLLRQLYNQDSVLVRIASKNKSLHDYCVLVRFVVITWTPYPLVWAISDGSRTVNADVREALYAVVEVLNKLGFLCLYLDIVKPANVPRWLRFTSHIIGHTLGRRAKEGLAVVGGGGQLGGSGAVSSATDLPDVSVPATRAVARKGSKERHHTNDVSMPRGPAATAMSSDALGGRLNV